MIARLIPLILPLIGLGAGVGAVGLCIAARVAGCHIAGIELQPELAALAERFSWQANAAALADHYARLLDEEPQV